MNERIRELWSQVCKEEMPELDETCMTLQRQRKFAELVVKECQMQNVITACSLDLDANPFVDQLAKYFGVQR